MKDVFCTAHEAVKILGLSSERVQRLLEEGELQGTCEAGRWYVAAHAVHRRLPQKTTDRTAKTPESGQHPGANAQAPVIASASQATPNEGETGTHQAQTIAGLSDQGITPPQTDLSGDETAAKPALEGPAVSAAREPSSGSDRIPSTTPLGDRFSRWIQDQLHERQIHSRGLSPTSRTLGFEAIAALLDSRTLSLDRSFDR